MDLERGCEREERQTAKVQMVRDGQMWVDQELGEREGGRERDAADRREGKGSREKSQIWLVMATEPA